MLRRDMALAMVAVTWITLGGSTARAGTPSCAWIAGVQNWKGSFGWTWSHHDSWAQFPSSALQATTLDGGSGTFALDGSLGAFSGDIDGALSFDDDYEVEDIGSGDVTFTHTVLSGPIVGPFGSIAQMVLQLDQFNCVYTWNASVYGDGTVTSESGSEATELLPNAIFPGTHPIPPLPEPLTFSGPATVTLDPQLLGSIPQFVPYGAGATASLSRQGPPAPSPAQLSWIFEPGDTTAPPNDTCAGATFVFGGDTQDTSFATSDASDPGSSCGAGDRSVWFVFFAPDDGTAQISTAGSGYSTVVSVWPITQNCGALATEVACGSNGASLPVQANTAYRVQVQRSGSGGTGALQVTISIPEPSAAAAALAAFAALARSRRVRSLFPRSNP